MTDTAGLTGLKEYLKKHKETQKQFSKRSGVSESAMSQLMVGKGPSLLNATRIQEATGGEIEAISWVRKGEE